MKSKHQMKIHFEKLSHFLFDMRVSIFFVALLFSFFSLSFFSLRLIFRHLFAFIQYFKLFTKPTYLLEIKFSAAKPS